MVVALVPVLMGGCSSDGDPPARPSGPAEAPLSAPLVFASPVGELRRLPTTRARGTQWFRRTEWPEGVVAAILEADAFAPVVGDLDTYPLDRVAGTRELHRFPQDLGSGERRWVEPDGRLWTVRVIGPDGDPPWTGEELGEQTASLVGELAYERGAFTPVDDEVTAAELTAVAERWGDLPLLWQVSDDRLTASGFGDTTTDVDTLAGDPVELRGTTGRMTADRLVWREDEATVVVIGSSIAVLDDISRADLSGRPYGGVPLSRPTTLRAAEGLITRSETAYRSVEVVERPDRAGTVVVTVPDVDGPLWVRAASADGAVTTTVAAGADGVAVVATAAVDVWASAEPYGPREPPACAARVEAAVSTLPSTVTIGADCIVAAR